MCGKSSKQLFRPEFFVIGNSLIHLLCSALLERNRAQNKVQHVSCLDGMWGRNLFWAILQSSRAKNKVERMILGAGMLVRNLFWALLHCNRAQSKRQMRESPIAAN